MADAKDNKKLTSLEFVAQRAAEAKARIDAKVEKKVTDDKKFMLPFWPDGVRRVPNLVLRNALFGVTKDREFYGDMRLVASLDGHTVKVTERLNQYDLDNLEMLLHLQREQLLGSRVAFTAHAFLKAMGRGTGGNDHTDLHDDLTRLARATVEIGWTSERKSYVGSLVSGYARDEDTGMICVTFNEDLIRLYNAGSTQIDLEQRQKLGKSNLAKWLQVFYASHGEPYPMKVDTIRALSGSTTTKKEFKRLLKAALDKLVDVGLLSSWNVDNELVTVVKNSANLKKLKTRG